MSPRSYLFRSPLAAIVCLLILGVVSLGAQAKAGQYDSHKTFTGYLAKSTKMSDSGVQRAAAAPPLRVEPLCVPDTDEALVPAPADPVPLPASPFLDTVRVRPPPQQ